MGVSRSQQSAQASALTAAPNSQTGRLAGRQLDERLRKEEFGGVFHILGGLARIFKYSYHKYLR